MSEEQVSRQRKWQLKQKAKGLCMLCSEPLKTKHLCAKHAAAVAARHNANYADNPAFKKRLLSRGRQWRKDNPDYHRNYNKTYYARLKGKALSDPHTLISRALRKGCQ